MLQTWQDEEQIRQRVAQVKLQFRRVGVAETAAAWSTYIFVPQQLTNQQLRPKRESESLGTCFIGGKQIAAVRIPWKCESRPGMGGKQMPLHYWGSATDHSSHQAQSSAEGQWAPGRGSLLNWRGSLWRGEVSNHLRWSRGGWSRAAWDNVGVGRGGQGGTDSDLRNALHGCK